MSIRRFLQTSYSKKQDPMFSIVKGITGISPKDLSLYTRVFTHTSMEETDADGKKINYERLEFLGDAVLNTIVAAYLFRELPQNNEGSLTLMRSKIVRRDFLNQIGDRLGLIRHLSSNVPEKNYGPDIHGNLFEAIVGAVYLDCGYDACATFVHASMISPHVNLIKLQNKVLSYKSLLVDWFQKNRFHYKYEVVSDNGAEKTTYYKAKLWLDNKVIATARATNKKKAIEKVSKRACFQFQHQIKFIQNKH
ncbi:MAG: Ribonuclease 3 [Bacteroidota bacterium]|nr:MAG: Ribonuclease 3 [Bacteroidota bacterium]